MLFINGGKDIAFPPDIHAKTYELVKSEKNIYFVPELTHGYFFDKPKEIEIFIEYHLKSGDDLHKITMLNIDKDKIEAKVKSSKKLVSAELHYTFDKAAGKPDERLWQKYRAKIDHFKVTAELPPKETQMWFLTVIDERGALASSNVVFPK